MAGDQAETPSVVWNEETSKFHMYFQQEAAGLNQSTFLATSPDGITWTGVSMVIQGIPGASGEGQSSLIGRTGTPA